MACSHYVSGAAKPIHWTGEPHAVVNLKVDFDGSITAFTGAAACDELARAQRDYLLEQPDPERRAYSGMSERQALAAEIAATGARCIGIQADLASIRREMSEAKTRHSRPGRPRQNSASTIASE